MKRKAAQIIALALALSMSIGCFGAFADETEKTINNQYNSFDFIKGKMPETPKLRFSGTTREEYDAWQKETKATLLNVMGVDKLEKTDAVPELIETVDFDTYTRFKYSLETTTNLKMPFYVLAPKENPNGKAAIALHGHNSDGKEGLVGNESDDYKESVQNFNYSYAMELLQKGYTVYVPDLLGAGERMLGIYKDKTAECNDINNALTSLGYSLQGVILFENMKLADYIKTQNYSETVCIGFSGGGQSALWLSVMSDNVDRTIVSGFMHPYADTLIYNNRCGCNFVPGMWEYVDMGDILSLAADKEIYIETGNSDNLNGERGITGVDEQIAIANKCFNLFGKEVPLKVNEGGHKWYGSWMDQF